jgi:filamentous hemagglutinin family protein
MSQKHTWLQYSLLCSLILLTSKVAHAQITPDNTLGAESSRLTPNVQIKGAAADSISGGAQRGSNLFHSFSQFNVGNGQRVYFVNPLGIQNILTRVTGKEASSILGTLGVNGSANLFLLNPNGILFGPNARLDIGGSFVGTTASAFRFGEQGEFSATNPEAPPLLTVNPSALFFNQLNPGAIANQGLLRVPDGKSLLLVGGNVNLDRGRIEAFGGRVELGGLASPGTVGLGVDGNNLSLSFPENVTRANISLRNRAIVYVDAAGGGSIAVNAKNLDILQGSALLAGIASGLGLVEAVAGDITLNATGEIKVVGSGVFNVVQPQAVGKGGNINVTTGSLSLTNGAVLGTTTYGQGDAGSVFVQAKDSVSLVGKIGIYSDVGMGAVGNGGNINITTSSLSLTDGAGVSASTYAQGNGGSVLVLASDSVSLAGGAVLGSIVESGAVGNGGNVDITAASLSLKDGSQLLTQVREAGNNLPSGRGNAGNVNVNVTGTVTISGMKDGFSSGIVSTLGTGAIGKGGNISVKTGSLSLSNRAALQARTRGQGDAGNVLVEAKDSVSLTGRSDILSTVEPGAVGNGGNINITAATLSLTDAAQLITLVREASSNLPPGRGNAGNVTVNVTGSVTIAGVKDQFSSGIGTRLETGAIGKGGNVNVTAGSLSVTDGSQLDASTFGRGDAGNIQINATDSVTVAGSSSITGRPSALFTDTNSTGKGGDITVNTNVLRVSDGALLNAPTTSDGNGGNITVNANTVEVLNGGAFLAYSNHSGRAGKITVNASDRVIVNGNDPTFNERAAKFGLFDEFSLPVGTNVAAIIGFANSGFYVRSLGSGATGDIEVTSPQIRLDNQGRFIAESASANGGNIILNSDLLLMRGKSSISTTAGLFQDAGDGGNITINGKFIVAVPKENSDITANAFQGRGGNITINTQGLFGIIPASFPTPQSDITASSELGVQGQISITEPEVEPTSGLIELPDSFVDATNQIAQICPRSPNAKPLGEFIITGRGSLQPNPLEPLPGTPNLSQLATLDSQGSAKVPQTSPEIAVTSSTPPAIVEAQGWVKDSDGNITLVAFAPDVTPSARPTTGICPVSK